MEEKKLPSVALAFVPLLILVGLLACVISAFGSDALSGASQIALLTTSACCILLGLVLKTMRWEDFEVAVNRNVSGVSQAILILLLIGAVGGSWMVSGIVPTMIYYGMQIIHPQWFLVSSCLICAAVSVITGSSWTTIATIGIALLGIGKAQGFGEGWIAGAIVSGAYFGDKISPMSETTVLASSTTGTPLFTHIRYMTYTTIPAFAVGLVIFTVAGLTAPASSAETAATFASGLSRVFVLSPWLMVVPLVTGVMIAHRLPAVVILFSATLLACVAAVVMQTRLIDHISGGDYGLWLNRFRGVMILVYGSTGLETGVPELNELVATRGMAGMMSTVWLIFCAMIFGASMSASGMIESIMRMFIRRARGTFSLVGSTVGVGLFMNIVCADQYLSLILTGNMFRDVYRRMGYESRLLSRTTEDAVTVTSVLIPWNSCGMTQSMVLGVSTLTYLPFCFFNYLSPVMTLVVAAVGYKIRRTMGKTEPQAM
ncbi:MAG: hypothetical protein NC388_07335 [Clostridium sp.]|nr:hypothetical protein [Clostridium sp.]